MRKFTYRLFLCVFSYLNSTNYISMNYISFLQVQEAGTSKGCDNLFLISDTVHESVFPEYGDSLSSRQCAHAQVKYQDNSTSGRGARASYQTISPEISARGSLL